METFLQYDTVTASQYNFLYNVLSFAFAAFFAAAIGFFLARGRVEPKYRTALTLAGVVALVASYHYFRIFQSWDAAYEWTAAGLVRTDEPFNVAYRYADWLLTVPLLMIELIDVAEIPSGKKLATWLAVAAALMIALGYPGEVATTTGTAMLFWSLSMLPFLGIFGYLAFRFGKHVKAQPEKARPWLNGARWLTALVWWVYPILFLIPLIGWRDGAAVSFINAMFAVADLVAKVGLGLLITAVAFAKSRPVEEARRRMPPTGAEELAPAE
jgi:bacteriorhodopsin